VIQITFDVKPSHFFTQKARRATVVFSNIADEKFKMRAENIIGRLRQNLHSKSTREGHQKNAGVKDTFPVQWSGENLGSSLHHKV